MLVEKLSWAQESGKSSENKEEKIPKYLTASRVLPHMHLSVFSSKGDFDDSYILDCLV